MPSGFFVTTTAIDGLNAGRSLTGLDLNGDGLGDLIIGADFGINPVGDENGQVLVIYGNSGGFDSSLSVDDLDGTNGFVIFGPDVSAFGWSVANAGDVNNDGRDDLIVGAIESGEAYVIFGQADDFAGNIDLADTALDGTDGFAITGLPEFADNLIVSSAGDINGDGIDDIAIGTADAGGTVGATYIVFGTETPAATIDVGDLDGSNGFELTGGDIGDALGQSVTSLGDINGDGLDDLLVGTPGGDAGGSESGQATILFGSDTGFAATVDADGLATGGGVQFSGGALGDALGASVTGGGDFNDDGTNDIVIAATLADPNGASSGQIYVVYGDAALEGDFDLGTLDGTNGFVIEGLSAGDQLGSALANLGDVSGDGVDDLGLLTVSGDLFVVFGTDAGFPAVLDLGTLNGSNGYKIDGLFDVTADSVTLTGLPDINSDAGDPIADIAVGVTFDGELSGQTFVILGGAQNLLNLDEADGVRNGEIAFDDIVVDVEFEETDTSIIVGGDTLGELTEDEGSVSGSISIEDIDGPDPTFANATVAGARGVFLVNAAGNLWTYTVNDVAAQQFLNAGESLVDQGTLEADDGTTRTITITIQGQDDAPVFAGDLAPSISEDAASITGAISVTDVDDGQDPSIANVTVTGTFGYLEVNAAGDGYTYFLTNPAAQDLTAGNSLEDTLTVTADDGSETDVVVTIQGADEPGVVTGDDTDEIIETNYGDDDIDAGGGDDTINSGGGDDTVSGGEGNDTIIDPLGDDTVDGDEDNDLINLFSGENDVNGGAGNDYIRTGFQNDIVDGDLGNDVISADSGAGFLFGNDIVTGGAGDDLMMAGDGVDQFVFTTNDGTDTIAEFNEDAVTFDAVTGYSGVATGADFEVGIDKIVLQGFAGVDASNVMSFVTAGADGAEFSTQGTTIVFFNVLATSLSADDFLFDVI